MELLPGGPDDPLWARLIHNPSIPLSNRMDVVNWSMEYEALSYIWGAPPPSQFSVDFWHHQGPRIVLDEEHYLPIFSNLDVALRHLRSPDAPRALWIDAICINQQDLEERIAQVAIMINVYSQAKVVNIWLGPANGDSPMGMETLKYLAESNFDNPPPWVRNPKAASLEGLREVIDRDYFKRIWVVQEAAVSQKAIMMCGNDSLQWSNDPIQVRKFIRRIKYAAISPQWEQAGLSQLNLGFFLQVLNMQMQHIERQHGMSFMLPLDILDVAFEMRHRKATDPRDKLFAVMGLVDGNLGGILQSNYSMGVETVFQNLLDAIEI